MILLFTLAVNRWPSPHLHMARMWELKDTVSGSCSGLSPETHWDAKSGYFCLSEMNSCFMCFPFLSFLIFRCMLPGRPDTGGGGACSLHRAHQRHVLLQKT